MNLNNLTIKSQEAIQSAQQLAESLTHQSIEPTHILKGMMEVDDNPFLRGMLDLKIKQSDAFLKRFAT